MQPEARQPLTPVPSRVALLPAPFHWQRAGHLGVQAPPPRLQTGVGIESHSSSILEPSFSLLSGPSLAHSPVSPPKHGCRTRENGVHSTASRKRRGHWSGHEGRSCGFPGLICLQESFLGWMPYQTERIHLAEWRQRKGQVRQVAEMEARLGGDWRGLKRRPDIPLQGCPLAPCLHPRNTAEP